MKKQTGISLLIFTVLIVFTMVLHPLGGNIEHLIRITGMIVLVHAVAILSLPFGWIGFIGLTRVLGTERYLSMLAFALASMGIIAAMIAAATNGIILPVFLQHYKDASPEVIASIKPVWRYSFAINSAFDYIYTFAFCLAILLWSILIIHTKTLSQWLGWLGIIIAIGGIVFFISGMRINSLYNFRLFITSIIVWIALVAVQMISRSRSATPTGNHP